MGRNTLPWRREKLPVEITKGTIFLALRRRGSGDRMQHVKLKSIHKRSKITRFQRIVISLLFLFLFCDIFIVKHISFSVTNAFMVNFFYLLQIVLSGICMEQNYPSLCTKMRKFKNTCIKTQFPLYLYHLFESVTFSSGALLLIAFCFTVNTVLSGNGYYALDNTLIAATVVIEAILTGVSNMVSINYGAGEEKSQVLGVKNFYGMEAIERNKILKRFLQVLLMVDVGICIYSFGRGNEFSFLNSIYCFFNVIIASVSVYYTMENVKIALRGTKSFLSNRVIEWLGFLGTLAFYIIMPSIGIFLCYLPTSMYFAVSAVLVGYALFLNKFGKYPFIDYELQLPN